MLKKFNSEKKGDLSDDFKEQERIKKTRERESSMIICIGNHGDMFSGE